ncbi:MAG: DUF11 domain-containing protein [Chloroflexi bacterium]|nr:DUF11 domain-containing protein [Chloroflexota bacterium]
MNLSTHTLLVGLVLLMFFSNSPTQASGYLPPGQERVPINGTAYWAMEPTGPDFYGANLIPFQPRNPTRAIWEMTQAQNQRHRTSDAIPQNIQVSRSGWTTGASHFVNDFSEVMVYLDPTNPNHLLGASKFFYDPSNYGFFTGVFESYDGGHTWTQSQPLGVESYSLTSDPVTTFDDQGNGYFTLLTRGPTGLDMLKKPPGGIWQLPVVVDRTTYTDKQWIMGDQNPQGISPYAGYLYTSWTDVGAPHKIVFARSTDSNRNWRSPLALASGDVQGSITGVAPDGTVYVVFGRSIFHGTPGTIEFVKSIDGGVSFSSPAVAAGITSIPWYLPNSWFRSPASLPAFAASPTNGNLYVAWADYGNGDADIYLTRSTDGGDNWATPVRLNDDPVGNGIDQFQPQVSVAPNGRVAVMWFDRRLECPDYAWIPSAHRGAVNFCIDTFLTRSYDDGQTWMPNARVSAQTWDWTLNMPRDGGGNGFIGDYQGIASNNDYDFPFWNATANLGENAENYQEIFVALVPANAPDLSPSTKSVEPGVAALGGVLTFTIVLENIGPGDAPAVYLTDTLPISISYVSDSLIYPLESGTGGYDPATETITWTGAVSVGFPVTLTLQAIVSPHLTNGTNITNMAIITDGSKSYVRTARTTVRQSPFVVATYPADGERNVPLTASLVITFNEPIIPHSLFYAVAPDPGGWTEIWNDDDSAVTLNHADWGDSQTYTTTIGTGNGSGTVLMPGSVPNPWVFKTAPERVYRFYLPLILRE